MPELHSIFHQVAALLAVCAVLGLLATRLGQPLLIGFIAAGILAGPQALGLVEETPEIDLLATMGIAVLLFVVGLKLDLRLVRAVGPVALITGAGQIALTALLAFALASAIGLPHVTALYVGMALTFSSTVIIVKLLSDRQEIDDLHGRIAIGILIVQDIVVVVTMIGLSAFGGQGISGGLAAELTAVALKGALFVSAILALARWVLPGALHRLASSAELLLLFAVAWAIVLAGAGELLGFSEEVGAFLAGMSLASTPYRDALAARLVTLRDFLLLFFFINLGAQLNLGAAWSRLPSALALSALVLIGKPVIVMALMGFQGYPTRVSFRTGLALAQISEFSLILAALGLSLGHIGAEAVGLIIAVALLTIALSTYLIDNSSRLYERLAPLLGIIERAGRTRRVAGAADADPPADVVVFGVGRYGGNLVTALQESGRAPLGVDFNPQAVRAWQERGLPVVYGDAYDPELPHVLPLRRVEWVVSSVRDVDTNLALVQSLAQHGYTGRIAVTALSAEDAELLERAGAHRVLQPFADAAHDAVAALFAEPG